MPEGGRLRDEVAERAERASRETAHTGPHEDKQTGGTLDALQGGGGMAAATGAPPSGTSETQNVGGTGSPAGPDETARPEESPGGSAD